MRFLVLCVLVLGSSAFDFDCLKGPDFWCASFANSQKCNKISECFMKNKKPFETAVKPSPHKIEDDIWCASCINVVEFAEENIPKFTQDQFLDYLNKETCDKLKANLINVCKVVVSEYGPMVYKEIQNIKNPKMICRILRVCPASGFESPLELFTNLKYSSSPEVCAKCKEFFHILESMFSKISQDEFKMLLETLICGHVPPAMQATCKMLVSGYSDQLYQLIKSLLDGDRICPLIHLCPQNETTLGTWNCATCLDVVTVLKKDLVGVSEPEVESYVKNMVCSKMSFVVRSVCDNYVSQLTPEFLNDIKSAMTPQQICNKNKVCSSQTLRTLLKTSSNVQGIQCEACELAMREVKKFISDPNRKALIKNFLKQEFCAVFQSKKTECQQVIDEFFDTFYNFIIAELDVKKICQLFHMCSAVVKTKTKGDAECAMCNMVIKEVIQVAFSNHSQQIVSNFLISDVCPHLSFVKSDCVSLVKTYLPQIFSIAESTLNSKVICSELHLCSVISRERVRLIKQQSPKNSLKCEVCQFVVNETKFLLTDSAIQTAIENFIKNEICVHFGTKQSECVKDINEYYSLVINVIVEFLNPSLCREFRLCNSTVMSPTPVKHRLINLVAAKKISPECPLCVEFYNYLQSMDKQQSDSAKIVLDLVQMCNQQNQEVKSQCLNIFRNFDPVVRAYNKSKTLAEFCQMAKMCSSKVKPRNIGSNPCSWGPSFWCLSKKHAVACGPGAVKHCEMKIWNQRPIL